MVSEKISAQTERQILTENPKVKPNKAHKNEFRALLNLQCGKNIFLCSELKLVFSVIGNRLPA